MNHLRTTPGCQRFVQLIVSLSLVLLTLLRIQAQPLSFVSDQTGLLSREQIKALNTRLKNYEQETTVEIAVYIAAQLDSSIHEVCLEVANTAGIGKPYINNGILIFIAPNDHQAKILIGHGLEFILPDTATHEVFQHMVSWFRQNNFYNGINQAVDELIAATCSFTYQIQYNSYAALKRDLPDAAQAVVMLRGHREVDYHRLLPSLFLGDDLLAVDTVAENTGQFHNMKFRTRTGDVVMLAYSNYMQDMVSIMEDPLNDAQFVVRVAQTYPLRLQLMGVKE